ncbi:MAG TPA: hypothetical protein VGM19_00410 [Armatimonadota bacterium]|jgi:hypothetical protein
MRHLGGRLLLVLVFAACVCGAYAATNPYTNPGFETGDLTGWTEYNNCPSQVVTSWTGVDRTYEPTAGSYFAVVPSLPSGGYGALRQQFSASAGDVLKGYAALDARIAGDSWLNSGDAIAYVTITTLDESDSWTPWYADLHATSGPWESWSWTAPASGVYVLEYYVFIFSDTPGAAVALYDVGLEKLGTTPLMAAKTTDAGTVTIKHIDDNLKVVFDTTGGWELLATHVWMGSSPPTGVRPDSFTSLSEGLGGVTQSVHSLALNGYTGTVYVSAEADVRIATGVNKRGSPVYQKARAWMKGTLTIAGAKGGGLRGEATYYSVEIPAP